MENRALVALAIGAHPDDVELFSGGTAASLAASGDTVVILDLTRGEMGSRGTPDERAAEARRAAAILGAASRENLDLGDARLECGLPQRHLVAGAIRRHRPDVILAPWWEDLHPDHAAAGRIVREALFDARLAKLDLGHPPFAPGLVLYYPCHQHAAPTVVVDISGVFEKKMEAIGAYRSQFTETAARPGPRPVGIEDYLWQIDARARYFGSLAGCRWAEGFILPEPLLTSHPGCLLPRRET